MSDDLLFHMCDVACIRSYSNKDWEKIHLHLLKLAQKVENNGWKVRSGMTQTQRIIEHMQKNGSITKREAEIDYHIQNFSARMSEIRSIGYKVTRVNKKHPTTGQAYSRYFLS